jgi:inorganic pyrophosphatase
VTKDSPLFDVDDVSELDTHFPGVLEIIQIWFAHYKGQNAVTVQGWGNKEEAKQIIKKSMGRFIS